MDRNGDDVVRVAPGVTGHRPVWAWPFGHGAISGLVSDRAFCKNEEIWALGYRVFPPYVVQQERANVGW